MYSHQTLRERARRRARRAAQARQRGRAGRQAPQCPLRAGRQASVAPRPWRLLRVRARPRSGPWRPRPRRRGGRRRGGAREAVGQRCVLDRKVHRRRLHRLRRQQSSSLSSLLHCTQQTTGSCIACIGKQSAECDWQFWGVVGRCAAASRSREGLTRWQACGARLACARAHAATFPAHYATWHYPRAWGLTKPPCAGPPSGAHLFVARRAAVWYC